MPSFRKLLSMICAGASLIACSDEQQARKSPQTILVLAAADLQYAFEEIGTAFEHRTGVKPVFNFGSSGLLAREIAAGAPADVFASANTAYVQQLLSAGLITSGTDRLYARGRITVWLRSDSPLNVAEMSDLKSDRVQRVAIANPDHAPYGIAAREALTAVGLWKDLQPRLVYGENIRDTLRYGESGNVDVAIVALSLSVRTNGRYFKVPSHLHAPIDQSIGVIRSSTHPQHAKAFTEFVVSPDGRKILSKYGFELPG